MQNDIFMTSSTVHNNILINNHQLGQSLHLISRDDFILSKNLRLYEMDTLHTSTMPIYAVNINKCSKY